MLSQKEFENLESDFKKLNLTAKQLINLIADKYVSKNPMQDSHTGLRKKDHIHQCKKQPGDLDHTEQRKREIQGGIKVRTEGESMKGQKGDPMESAR